MRNNQEIRRNNLERKRRKKDPELMDKYWRSVKEAYEKAYKDLDKVVVPGRFTDDV